MAANLAFYNPFTPVDIEFPVRRQSLKLESLAPFRFQTFLESQSQRSALKSRRNRSVAVPAQSHTEVADEGGEVAHARSHSAPTMPSHIAHTLPSSDPAQSANGADDTMASTSTPLHHHNSGRFEPFTPLNKTIHNASSTPTTTSTQLRDSPFSDYFSDSTPPSSPEKQQLLTRMKQLQVLLMQGEQEAERETLNIVERKISEIETQLSTMHSQTRMPPELEDSGLFMEDDEDDEEEEGLNVEDAFFEPPTPITVLLDAPLASELPEEEEIVEDEADPQLQHDTLLAESQRVLASVSRAQEQLRERCKELKALNSLQITTMDELRTENESLRSALEENESDLHYLHHKFRKLEIEVQALDAGAQRLETYAPEIREDIQRVKRKRMSEEMARWQSEWSGVEERMSARRRSEMDGGLKDKGMAESYVQVQLEEEEEDVKGLGLQALETTAENGPMTEIVIKQVTKDDWRAPKIVGSYPRDSSSNASEEAISRPQSQPEAKDFDQRAMTATTMESFDNNLVLTATGSPVSQSLFDRPDYDTDEDDDDEREDKLKLDCAITTSSEDNSVPFYSNRSKKAARTEKRGETGEGKSAWKEFVDGLAGLAGMGEW